MRLIDADALLTSKSAVGITAFYNNKMHRYIDAEQVELAPTIDIESLDNKNKYTRMCEKCGAETYVTDSRVRVDGAVRRRRACRACGFKYTTVEVYLGGRDSEVCSL